MGRHRLGCALLAPKPLEIVRTKRCTQVAESGVLTIENLSPRLGDRGRSPAESFMLNESKRTIESDSRCPITAMPSSRLEWDRITDSIKDNFPKGIGRPALRALFNAGLTKLEHLSKISEKELTALHGMGRKGVEILRAALHEKGLGFRT